MCKNSKKIPGELSLKTVPHPWNQGGSLPFPRCKLPPAAPAGWGHHQNKLMETPSLDFKYFTVETQLLTKEMPENKGIVTCELPQPPCRCTWHFCEGGDT